MLGLIAPADEDAVDPGNWIVWTKGLGNWSEQDADQGYQGYSQNTGGVAIGADRQILSGVRVGLDLGYTDSDLEWEDTADSGSLQGRHLGLYASADAGNFFADAVVGYADFGNEAERVIAFGGYRTVAKGSFDASVWTGRLTGGYNFPVGSWLLGPVASLGYGHLAQDGFSESGAGFLGLDIADAEADSLISNLGLRLAGRIAGKQWQYVPRLELLWQHQFEDEGAAVTANFVNYRTASFEVTGIAPAADQGTATMGLSVDYGRNLSLYVDYGVALADGYTSQLVSGGLSWRF
jgi:outer membrane autotransporter protein